MLLALVSAPAAGQTPESFSDFEFVQFIESEGTRPQNVLDLDNNGALALACVKPGCTRERLRRQGIPFTESQLALLESYRLLRDQDGSLETTFPILGTEETSRLRALTRAKAEALVRGIRAQVVRLLEALSATDRRDNAYPLLFSYVVDGLVWKAFESKGILQRRERTIETPFWSGEVWAVYPRRPFSCGTNSISEHGIAMKVTWTERAIPKMRPFVADWGNLLTLFNDYATEGRVTSESARRVFEPFRMFDSEGRVTVPVIREESGDPLFEASRALADALATRSLAALDPAEIVAAFHLRDEAQAVVIGYHELMWDLMDVLEEQELVRKPVALADPDRAKPADIGALVFFVHAAK